MTARDRRDQLCGAGQRNRRFATLWALHFLGRMGV